MTLIGFAEIIPSNTKPVLLNSFVKTEKSKQLCFSLFYKDNFDSQSVHVMLL